MTSPESPKPDGFPVASPVIQKVVHDPEFLALIKKKNTISFSLTAVMLAVYFGFAIALAYFPEALAARVGNATLGIPLGIGVIILACVLTGIYVRWANTKYDSLIAHLNARLADKNLDDKTKNVSKDENAQ